MRPATSFYDSAGALIVSGVICTFLFGWYNLIFMFGGIYFLLLVTNGFERGYKKKQAQKK